MVTQLGPSKVEILKGTSDSTLLADAKTTQQKTIAELIRYSFVGIPHDDRPAIHISRILDYVRTRFQFLGDDFVADAMPGISEIKSLNLVIREVLDDLDLVGDVAELSSGFWSALPTRYIQLPDSMVILSSLPTHYLRKMTGVEISARALSRTTSIDSLERLEALEVQEQTVGSWIGNLELNLPGLLESTLSIAREQAQPLGFDEPFQVYCPWLKPRDRQAFRWIEGTRLTSFQKGFLLFRSFARASVPRFWLGEMQAIHGQLKPTNEYSVPGSLATKIQFALDAKHGAENFVRASKSDEDIALDIDMRLPIEVYRLIRVLAIEEIMLEKWLRRYLVQTKHQKIIFDNLNRLGIKVIE